jgi:hypothetical protein
LISDKLGKCAFLRTVDKKVCPEPRPFLRQKKSDLCQSGKLCFSNLTKENKKLYSQVYSKSMIAISELSIVEVSFFKGKIITAPETGELSSTKI